MKKKIINDRCPFTSECGRKKCLYIRREAGCPYYSANAMPGAEIEDQGTVMPTLPGEDDIDNDSELEEEEREMNHIMMININRIYPHPNNPRKDLGDVSELAASIKEMGILQNLTVVPRNSTEYTVISGHRRLAASRLAGLTEVPCAIRHMTEEEQMATMIAENMQRADLTVPEQAECIQMMIVSKRSTDVTSSGVLLREELKSRKRRLCL